MVQSGRPQKSFAFWVTKARGTHSEYTILITISITTMVSQTHFDVAFIRTLPLFMSVTFFTKIAITHTEDGHKQDT
jgi:hypothetical protein